MAVPTRPGTPAESLPISGNAFLKGVLKQAAGTAGLTAVDLLSLRRTSSALFGQYASAQDVTAQMRLAGGSATGNASRQGVPESLQCAAMAVEVALFSSSERQNTRGEVSFQAHETISRTLMEGSRWFAGLGSMTASFRTVTER